MDKKHREREGRQNERENIFILMEDMYNIINTKSNILLQ